MNDKTQAIIEPAKLADAPTIFAIQHAAWLGSYPNKGLGITVDDIRLRLEGEQGERMQPKIAKWRDCIENKTGRCAVYVARSNGETVGFVVPSIYRDQRRIRALCVLPQAQDIADELLKKAIAWHGNRTIYVHVVSYDLSALKLYERYGFTETGELASDNRQDTENKDLPKIEMVLKRRAANKE